MKTIVAALVVSLAAAGSAFAGNPGGNHNNNHKPSHNGTPSHKQQFHQNDHHKGGVIVFNNYHKTFGKTFSGGYFYTGKHHSHWSYQCYWPKYKCHCYWCPATSCYYYWCGSAGCYYPISYIAHASPTVVAAPGFSTPPPAGIPGLPQ